MKNSFNIYVIKLGLPDTFGKSTSNLNWLIILVQPTKISNNCYPNWIKFDYTTRKIENNSRNTPRDEIHW